MRENEDTRRPLLVALAAMAGVALVSGLVIGLIAVVLFKASGVGGSSSSTDDELGAAASLVMPSYSATANASSDGVVLPAYTPTALPTIPSATATPTPNGDAITLSVAPDEVRPGERINFNGTYPAGEGASLQIQRRAAGRWVDFPVSATVSGGVFSTWITTGQPGANVFRMVDPAGGRESNVVTVTIG